MLHLPYARDHLFQVEGLGGTMKMTLKGGPGPEIIASEGRCVELPL